MNEIPSTPVELFTQLLGGGVLYGLVSTWLIDLLIRAWEKRIKGRISETKRRWVSIGVAVAVPVAAYLALVALGAAGWSVDGLYSAAMVGVAAVGGSKISYAARASQRKPAAPAPQTERLAPLEWFPTTPEQAAEFERTRQTLPTVQDVATRAPSPPPARGAPAPAAEGAPSLPGEEEPL